LSTYLDSLQVLLWCINCGVPQGSILGPLLFLVYVKDIENENKSDIKLFADDTTLLYSNLNPTSTHFVLIEDLNRISAWAENGLLISIATNQKS